jgi:AraC-like DNA-binding protein
MKEGTVYKLTDAFYRHFLCLLLPLSPTNEALIIGPFLSEPVSGDTLLLFGEEIGISPQKQRYLKEYYESLSILPLDSPLMTVFYTFCELIWQSPSFSIEELEGENASISMSTSKSTNAHNPSESLVNIKAIEIRYDFENELMRSVSLGQLHLEDSFLSAFSNDVFEKRASDPLRNAKNYSIIMNTLLRKAAENGGVHPVYLDKVSSDFAHKIELLPSASKVSALMQDMFRTYCRLVRRHNLKKYSPVVQKTILTIDSDLGADLSAKTLSQSQNISLGYLSAIFRKEVGQTLSSYVRQKRMEHAKYLLSRTELQVQSVALHCGILDVVYFTKSFKREVGMTPSEYRAAQKSSEQA